MPTCWINTKANAVGQIPLTDCSHRTTTLCAPNNHTLFFGLLDQEFRS